MTPEATPPKKRRRAAQKTAPAAIPSIAAAARLQSPTGDIDPSNPPVVVRPGLKWADARALLYGLIPVLAAAFVTAGWLTGDLVNLVVPLALAILSWPVQALNSLATWRTYIYHILGAVNVLAIGVGWWTDTAWAPWVGLGGMVITNVLAYWFTPTTGTPTPLEAKKAQLARKT